MKSKSLILTLVIVTSAGVGIICFILFRKTLSDDMVLGESLFRLTYQFLLFAILGGAISLLFKNIQVERERRETRRITQQKLYSGLVAAFHEGRAVRRLIRARALQTIEEGSGDSLRKLRIVKQNPYDEQMAQLNSVLSEIELLRYEVEADEKSFGSISGLNDSLETVEKYLTEIVAEYQNKFRDFEDGSFSLPNLPKLEKFVFDVKYDKTFKQKFTDPMHNAIGKLRNAILS